MNICIYSCLRYIWSLIVYIYVYIFTSTSMKSVIEKYVKSKEEHLQLLNPASEVTVCSILIAHYHSISLFLDTCMFGSWDIQTRTKIRILIYLFGHNTQKKLYIYTIKAEVRAFLENL